MTADEAATLVKQAFNGEATVRTMKGVCEVVGKDGTVLGRAFSWRPAVQQAVKPLLDAKQREMADAWEARKKDLDLFLEFLREELAGKFLAWKEKRNVASNPDPGSNPGRAQADQTQLVQKSTEGIGSGATDSSRLILP